MRNKFFFGFLVLSFIFQQNISAQTTYISDDPKYIKNVQLADSAYQVGNYKLCTECYEKAFEVTTKSHLSVYRAARCYALSKKAKNAQLHLEKAMTGNLESVIFWLKDDQEFDFLKKKKKHWKKIQEKIDAYEATINVALRNELLKIQEEDQKYRHEISKVANEKGWNSPEVGALWQKQMKIDSANILRIEEIIEEHGYPGKSLVGSQAMGAAFLVIQHADLSYQEKYLPIMKAASDQGEMRKSSLALLIDRINMRNGKPQIYGSQVVTDTIMGETCFHEIEDEENVDTRRAEMELGPLSEYAQRFGFEYPRKPMTEQEIKKMIGEWVLISIIHKDEQETTIPEKEYWIKFQDNGRTSFNKEVNTCRTGFQVTKSRKIKFSQVKRCEEKCCDRDISSQLRYADATVFDVNDNRLVLKSEKANYVFEKKKYQLESLKKSQSEGFEKKN